ncbi:MAG: RNA polymerase factor sigma-54, partial [Bacteroidia bacterium]
MLQKLSPQQIQLMKMLQLPTLALEERIKEELELNPALEEDDSSEPEEELYDNENESPDVNEETDTEVSDYDEPEVTKVDDQVEMEDYMGDEEMDSYKYEVSNQGADNETREFVVVEGPDFHSQLETQLGLRDLDQKHYTIGLYLIGCVDEDGYIRREVDLIVDDLAFTYNIHTDYDTVMSVLKIIQEFDPVGVGSRNLQECLLIQLERKRVKTRETMLAI